MGFDNNMNISIINKLTASTWVRKSKTTAWRQ